MMFYVGSISYFILPQKKKKKSYFILLIVIKIFIGEFGKLWSSLNNTLHHDTTEMNINLCDLKIMSLPGLSVIYDEFIPTNELLIGENASGSLRIHEKRYTFLGDS